VNGKIYIIFEHHGGEISPDSFERVSFAKRLGKNCATEILIIGDALSDMAHGAAEMTGLDVTAFQVPGATRYNSEVYRHILADFLKMRMPAVLLAGHTSQGTDFTPTLAVELGAAHITGVVDFTERDGGLLFGRSVYGGKRIAWVRAETDTLVLSLMPGVSKATRIKPSRMGKVRIRSVRYEPQRIRVTGQRPPQNILQGLDEAEVIVAGGNGIGDRENVNLLRRLAACFTKSAVAGSRIVCDREWLPYGCQVGVTGATVSPRLYIACGISGAPQHLSGMLGSEWIVAVNRDPNAAIMNASDLCVVEDLTRFIPALVDAVEATESKDSR